MKKLLLALVVASLLPLAAAADWAVGGAAFFKSPVLLGQAIDTENMNVDQFSFGGDLLYRLGWFQAQGLLLYSAGEQQSLNMYLDAGVSLDAGIVRLFIGAGPNLVNNFDSSAPVQAGLNTRIGADIVLGPVSCGLSYIMALNIDNGIDITTASGLLGAHVLYWL